MPSFGFGSACCIEDFLVGLFFLPDEGEYGRGPTKGAAFCISSHFTSLESREGKFGRKALLSENEKGGVGKSVAYATVIAGQNRIDKTE